MENTIPPALDTSLQAPAPEAEAPQRRGFIARHYHGEYSLARSYWLHSVGVSLWTVMLAHAVTSMSDHVPVRVSSIAVILQWALGIVMWFWAIRGTWASANRHTERGGRGFWAGLAKFVIFIGAIRVITQVIISVPAIGEHIEVIGGAEHGPPMEVELLEDGQAMFVSGGFNDGEAEQLAAKLDAHPSVRMLVLSSGGGWLNEGMRMAELVRERKLNTHVIDECSSACTLAFLAGEARTMSPSGALGFHASRSVGSTATGPNRVETAELRAAYQQAGLPKAFIDKALATPHEDMWYPRYDALLDAGALTHDTRDAEQALAE
jgi:hypothetical protein